MLYDLDGFKLYNDTFGHPAGDTLLVRLSDRLRCAVEPHGVAYRMGGDEFCVLFDGSQAASENLVHSSVAALCEHSPNFSITASHGVVRIPNEVSDPSSIMQLADQRLYRRKEEAAARRASANPEVSAAARLFASTFSAVSRREPAELGRLLLPRSGDAHDREDALPLGEHDGGPLAGATPEQGARDRRIRRQPPF